jgi:PAS domain-containing protein
VSPNPIIVQAAVAIPISMGLALYTLIRWERATLHTQLALLLGSVTVWLAGMSLKIASDSEWLQLLGLDLEFTAVVYMPPLFLITMAYFARSPLFEQSIAPSIALFAISSFFFVAYLTNEQHSLFLADRGAALAGAPPSDWAGPFFWAAQIWTTGASLAAFGYIGAVLVRGPTRAERARAVMVIAAVLAPFVAHMVYLLKLLPVDYSLAPATLGITAIFFVQGVHRYGLFGGQTIVRHDLIEHLEDGLVLANEEGVVLDANLAAEAILSTTREDLRGLALPELFALLEPVDATDRLGERIVALPLDGGRVGGELQTSNGRRIEVNGTKNGRVI